MYVCKRRTSINVHILHIVQRILETRIADTFDGYVLSSINGVLETDHTRKVYMYLFISMEARKLQSVI